LKWRDKPVHVSDIQIFGKKCIDMGVREAAVVMVSDRQEPVDRAELAVWATSFGLGLTLFVGLGTFVDQVLFWSDLPKQEAAVQAALCVETRLLGVEASPHPCNGGNRLCGRLTSRRSPLQSILRLSAKLGLLRQPSLCSSRRRPHAGEKSRIDGYRS